MTLASVSPPALVAPEDWVASQIKYWDRVAPIYDELYVDSHSRREDAQTASVLGRVVHAGSAVVDLGAGTGLGLSLLTKMDVVPSSYVAVDVSERILSFLGAKFCDLPISVSLVRAEMTLTGLPTASADHIICLSSAGSYTRSLPALFGEVERLLRPGGTFALSFLSRLSPAELFSGGGKSSRPYGTRGIPNIDGVTAPVKLYSLRQLRDTCARSGLEYTGSTGIGLSPALRSSWASNFAHSIMLVGKKNT